MPSAKDKSLRRSTRPPFSLVSPSYHHPLINLAWNKLRRLYNPIFTRLERCICNQNWMQRAQVKQFHGFQNNRFFKIPWNSGPSRKHRFIPPIKDSIGFIMKADRDHRNAANWKNPTETGMGQGQWHNAIWGRNSNWALSHDFQAGKNTAIDWSRLDLPRLAAFSHLCSHDCWDFQTKKFFPSPSSCSSPWCVTMSRRFRFLRIWSMVGAQRNWW